MLLANPWRIEPLEKGLAMFSRTIFYSLAFLTAIAAMPSRAQIQIHWKYSNDRPSVGERIQAEAVLDLGGSSELVGSYLVEARWDTSKLQAAQPLVTLLSFGEPAPAGNANQGRLTITGVNARGKGGRFGFLFFSFTVRSAEQPFEGLALVFQELFAAHTFNDLLPSFKGLIAGIPTAYDLNPNYPNPFSGRGTIETIIAYDVPEQVVVRLEIYDILGRKVRTLAHAPHKAGAYTIRWDGKNDEGRLLSSGVYLYLIVRLFSYGVFEFCFESAFIILNQTGGHDRRNEYLFPDLRAVR